MKLKDQTMMSDGFDRNVAEKMPKVRKEEGLRPLDRCAEADPIREEPPDVKPIEVKSIDARPIEQEPEKSASEEKAPERREPQKKAIFSPPKGEDGKGRRLDVQGLIEDLHDQLMVSSQTKRALETDLASSQKTIHHLAQENKALRGEIEESKKEAQRFREALAETSYLREENSDALLRIQAFQQELKTASEALAKALRERDEALSRAADLESQVQQIEVLRIRGKLKEREATHLADENREIKSRLEQVQMESMELEKEYGEMKKSFNEIKESLTLLRDSCKASYYNLPQRQDGPSGH